MATSPSTRTAISSSLAAGETAVTTVTYTVSDGNGGTDTAVFSYQINGANDGPTATADTGASTESGSGSGNVLTNDTDTDASDTLSVTEVNGAGGNVASAVAGSGGGLFTVNADGSYSFDPNSEFSSLAAGETATTTVTYTVSDGNGGTDATTLTVTVTGQTDGPVATNDSLSTGENEAETGDLLANDTDPDTSDVLAVVAVNGTQGTNFIVNGSFEDTTGVTFDADGYDAASVTGWVSNNGAEFEALTTTDGLAPSDGSYSLDTADQDGDNIDISQTVSGLTDGETYRLSFDFGNRDDGSTLPKCWRSIGMAS